MLVTVCRNQEKLLIRPANHVAKTFFTIERKAEWRILNYPGNSTSLAQGRGVNSCNIKRKERGNHKIENYA